MGRWKCGCAHIKVDQTLDLLITESSACYFEVHPSIFQTHFIPVEINGDAGAYIAEEQRRSTPLTVSPLKSNWPSTVL